MFVFERSGCPFEEWWPETLRRSPFHDQGFHSPARLAALPTVLMPQGLTTPKWPRRPSQRRSHRRGLVIRHVLVEVVDQLLPAIFIGPGFRADRQVLKGFIHLFLGDDRIPAGQARIWFALHRLVQNRTAGDCFLVSALGVLTMSEMFQRVFSVLFTCT